MQRVLFDFIKDNARHSTPAELQYIVYLSMVDMSAKSAINYYVKFSQAAKDKAIQVINEFFIQRVNRAYELRQKKLRLVDPHDLDPR